MAVQLESVTVTTSMGGFRSSISDRSASHRIVAADDRIACDTCLRNARRRALAITRRVH